ncbi:N-6 DNA methylase [Aureispira]|nr:N-6 DNA methylase [Aureispira sp.]
MKTKEQALQLETIFFSTLDALRGIWDPTNASNVLLSLVFYKRILALHSDKKIDFLDIQTDDYKWIDNFTSSVVDEPQNAKHQLIKTFVQFSERNNYLKNIFSPLVTALEQEKNAQLLIQVVVMLKKIDFSSRAISISDFGTFFNKSLYRTALQGGKQGVVRTSPKSINKLIVALTSPKGGELIYDLTAGQGSSLIGFINKLPNLDIIAQEENINTWALCKMNLLVNGAYHSQITQGNCLVNDNYPNLKVDIAIAHFPFGKKISTDKIKDQSYISIPFDVNIPEVNCNILFIQKMLDKLNSEGQLICILPIQSLINDKENRKLREFLIRRDLLEAVITLPYGLLYSTGVPVCVLVINKKKAISRREHILFVNGANLKVNTQSKLKRELTEKQINSIADAYHDLNIEQIPELKECIALVPIHLVILKDYNLDAKIYASPFISELRYLEDKGKLIKLKQLFKDQKPALWYNETPRQNIPYIRSQDLGSSVTNYLININNLPNTDEISQVSGQLIQDSVLLVKRSGKKLRLGYFLYEDTPVLVSEEIMAFRVDETKIIIEYLLMKMYEKLFLQQLNMYKNDYKFKTINEHQFEELQISLPNLDEQSATIKEAKILLLKKEEQKVEKLRHDLNLGKQKAQSEQYKIISSLQHELGNRLPAVLTEFKNLKDYLLEKETEQQPINFSDPIFAAFEGEDIDSVDKLETILERMESILIHSINSIDSTGDIIKADRSKLKFEEIKIKNLLVEIKQLYQNEPMFDIQIEVEDDEKGREIPVYAKIDKSQISTVFTNLIDNAKRHGFIQKNKKYTIQFRVGLSSDQQEIIILYKNDGKAFPVNFTFEDFIGYGNYAGKTGHSGIGGYLIHQIIDNHNGSIVYHQKVDRRDPFKVQFEITLPILT